MPGIKLLRQFGTAWGRTAWNT